MTLTPAQGTNFNNLSIAPTCGTAGSLVQLTIQVGGQAAMVAGVTGAAGNCAVKFAPSTAKTQLTLSPFVPQSSSPAC